jgi:hypothetical protein
MTEERKTKILLKYASRGRRERFFDGLDNIFELSENKDRILVMVTLDEDDIEMCNSDVKGRLSEYNNVHVIYGISKNKIHATNRDLDKIPEHFKDWDIIANFSDDQRFVVHGWDTMIIDDFRNISTDFSHYIAYRDPDTNGALSTLYIAGRRFFDCFGFIYDEMFLSLFADNLVEDCARKLGKYHYTGYQIYQHFNPAYGYQKFEEDTMFREQQDIGWTVDNKTYNDLLLVGVEKYLEKFGIKSLTL